MDDILFWKKWDKLYRYTYITLLSFFCLCLVIYIAFYYIGIEAVIKWEVNNELDNIEVKVDEFSRHLFNYTVNTENYLIKQNYSASGITVNTNSSCLYLILMFTGIVVALTVVSYLELFWYIIGMAAFMLFLVNLNTEILEINGSLTKNFLIVLIIVFAAVSYYFNAFGKNISFLLRLLIFTLLITAGALYISFTAKVAHPFLYLANYGLVVPIAISVVFTVLVGFEIINVFLYLTSSRKLASGSSSLINFCVISLLYLTNILLLFLKKILIINWDILYVNAFLLLAISAIIGIWGYRDRSVLFNNILPFRPYGAILYLSFGIITFATVSYSFITGNDPLTEAFEYAIIYSHLCIGASYFIYVLINFAPLFFQNLAVYKVVYDPKRTPFFVVRGIGLIAALALFLRSSMFPFHLAISGYYNEIGDVYLYEHNYLLAKEYYLTGVGYEFQNHRSSYSVATVAALQNDKQSTLEYYLQATTKYPTEYDYANIANLYLNDDLFFQAMFTLQDGLKRFPKSGVLLNNLGLVYSKTSISDSTLYYLLLSENYLKDKSVAATNLLALAVKKNYMKMADSLQKTYKMEDKLGVQNNKLAFCNLTGTKFEEKPNLEFLKDTILNNNTFAYLYNLGVNNSRYNDTSLCKLTDSFEKRDINSVFSESLRFVNALSYYYDSKKANAKTTVEGLQIGGGMMSNYYSRILALWLTEQKAYRLAAEYFKSAQFSGGQKPILDYGIALAESGQKDLALQILAPLAESKDSTIKKTSNILIVILQTTKPEDVLTWIESAKYQYLVFRKNELSEPDLFTIYNSIKDEDLKTAANAEIIKHLLDIGNTAKAEIWLANPKEANKDYSSNLLHYQYLRLLAAQGQWQELSKQAGAISLNKDDEINRSYFKALAAEGLKQNDTESLLKQALQQSPFNEDVITSAVNFYNAKNEQMKAYDLMVESIQLNPASARLLMTYALQAVKVNLENYGESILPDLHLLLPEKEYQQFKSEFEKQKAIAEQNL